MCWLSDGRKVGQHHFKSAELRRCCSTTFFVLFYNGCISHTDAAGLTYCISLFLIRFFSVFPSTSKARAAQHCCTPLQPCSSTISPQTAECHGRREKPKPACQEDASPTWGSWHSCCSCQSSPWGWDDGLGPHKLKWGNVCFAVRKEMRSYGAQ